MDFKKNCVPISKQDTVLVGYLDVHFGSMVDLVLASNVR
jgi:hypothetical protein